MVTNSIELSEDEFEQIVLSRDCVVMLERPIPTTLDFGSQVMRPLTTQCSYGYIGDILQPLVFGSKIEMKLKILNVSVANNGKTWLLQTMALQQPQPQPQPQL